MAERTRNKLTPEEYAVDFNRGAAYGNATGDIINGMEYVFSRSQDISEESIIQEVMNDAIKYTNLHNEHDAKIQAWKNLPEATRGQEPKLKQSLEIDIAKKHYDSVITSSQTRTQIFYNNLDKLNLGQVAGISEYREPMSPAAKKLLVDNRTAIIGDIKNKKLQTVSSAFIQYYTLGKTAHDVQKMRLGETLEVMANNPED